MSENLPAVIDAEALPIVAQLGTMDGAQTVARATAVANSMLEVVRQRPKLVVDIQGKKYPIVECWTTLGALVGVFPHTEWVKESGSWADGTYVATARVVPKTLAGNPVGGGEGLCSQVETLKGKPRWMDQYAVFSMAQTRAISKSLRMPLGWILQLAGIEATPAEEMQPVADRGPIETAATERPETIAPLNDNQMADLMLSPIEDEASGTVIVSEDFRRRFVWSAALRLSGGDTVMAEDFCRKWGSFEGEKGPVKGPLPWEKKKDGALKMGGKWLNRIFHQAKEEYSQAA